METISQDEIKYHPQSFADNSMRVFWWQEQIYRALRFKSATFFRKLFQDGVIQNLIDQDLLVESELTPLALDGYEMVIRHRKIPFVSYPDEWCAAMYKDAALVTIDLAIELAQWDLTLRDAHPWNVLYDIDKGKPVYVDWGSIAPIYSSTWSDYGLFCNFFLYPLLFMSYGQDRIARLLIAADEFGVLESDLSKLIGRSSLSGVRLKASLASRLKLFLGQNVQRLSNSHHQHFKRTLNWISSRISKNAHNLESTLESLEKKSHLNSLENVRRQVDSIILPAFQVKRLGHYDKSSLSVSPQDDWTIKQKNIHKILTELQPSSVLDIGSGTGWYSKLAALLGSKVVAFDIDESCITQLYHEARENNLPILPLIINFTKPTPARGLADRAGISAIDRFQCDLVLALGLVHHIALGLVNPIVGKQIVNFDQIAEGLALFSKQWVVVEFVPFEAQELEEWYLSSYPWYKLDNFINALRKQFRHVTTMPSHPEHCVLLLCQK